MSLGNCNLEYDVAKKEESHGSWEGSKKAKRMFGKSQKKDSEMPSILYQIARRPAWLPFLGGLSSESSSRDGFALHSLTRRMGVFERKVFEQKRVEKTLSLSQIRDFFLHFFIRTNTEI